MKDYEFALRYHVGSMDLTMDQIDDALFEAGCDDALVSHNGAGLIELDFTREAESVAEAVESAMECVKNALPNSVLVEAKPDYVGVTDVAEYCKVSRQYIQKLLSTHVINLVPLTVVGKSSVYRLAPAIAEIKKREVPGLTLPPELEELSALTMKINLQNEQAQQLATL